MHDPGFSVVIPLFNKQAYIAATLRSVLAQSLPAREVLVVDNGSQDGSLAELARFTDPRLRLLHEAARGPGPARNRGITEAASPWVAFIDADDLWAEDHLERLAEAIVQAPEARLVATGFRTLSGHGESPPPPSGPSAVRSIDFFAGNEADLIWTSAVAARRDAVLACGGFAAFPAGEDTDLWIRLALHGPFAVSAARTALYRRDNGGIMDLAQTRLLEEAPPPSPVFATMTALLADPAHAGRHHAIAAYSDGLRRRFAGQLVYNGHPASARQLLAGSVRRSTGWWLWWLASLIPAAVLRPLARLWSRRPRLSR